MPQQSDVSTTIRKFISDNFLFREDINSFDDSESFIESNIMDSTGVLELVFFVESTFGIKLKDSEIIPSNLDSVNAITAFIERKQASVSA